MQTHRKAEGIPVLRFNRRVQRSKVQSLQFILPWCKELDINTLKPPTTRIPSACGRIPYAPSPISKSYRSPSYHALYRHNDCAKGGRVGHAPSGSEALRFLQPADPQDRRFTKHVDEPVSPRRNHQAHPPRWPRAPRKAAPQPPHLPAPDNLQDGADLVRRLHLDPYHRRRSLSRLLRLLWHLPRRAPPRLARREPVPHRRFRCPPARREGWPQVPRRLAFYLPLLQRYPPLDLRFRSRLRQA